MRAARAVLIAAGLVLIGVGVVALVPMRFPRLADLVIWLACAVLLHDGVFVPLTLLLSAASARAGRALPTAALSLVRIGFVVGALVTLVVAPELYAQARGNSNPTILAFDYGIRLAVMWGVIIVIVALGSTLIVLWGRRTRRRRKTDAVRSTPAPE